MSDSTLLKPSEIAELAKILPSKVRHYTELELLRPAAFTEGGFKLYDKTETLERLKQISALSDRGMSLDEIKAQLVRTPSQKKVLLVDDDQTVMDFYEIFFPEKFPGWEYKVANNGFVAGRIISTWVPDLVMLDLMMPGLSGFQVCKDIRSDAALSHVKILAVTGYYGSESQDKIMSIGANDYMTKPLDMNKLYEKICELLNLDPKSTGQVGSSSAL